MTAELASELRHSTRSSVRTRHRARSRRDGGHSAAVRECRSRGAKVLAIVNAEGSSLTKLAGLFARGPR